jgi:hypothetical protein
MTVPEEEPVPLSEETHAAVQRYRQDAVHAVRRIGELATDVDALAQRIAVGGPLGTTADPDLTRAREHLARARARIAAARTAVAASPEPAQEYAARAFPAG